MTMDEAHSRLANAHNEKSEDPCLANRDCSFAECFVDKPTPNMGLG